jgi:primosomal protein N' (replication factor Y)
VRPASDGGVVVLVADPALPAVQAVVRGDPAGFAARELSERELLHLPPAWRVAELTGRPDDVADLLGHARLPASATVLGPVPVPAPPRAVDQEPRVRALVPVPRRDGGELAAALHAAAAVRSARKDGGPVTVRIDPVVLG